MENSSIREPIQKRAVEKKNKIIEYGFNLMCEKGYHNTDTVEIAKAAGVSTGIIYQYFNDKRDIFLQGLEIYSKDLMFPISTLKDKKISKDNLEDELRKILKISIKSHKISLTAHEEILAMQHTDSAVAEIFQKQELETTQTLVDILTKNNIVTTNVLEKAHLIITWIDELSHELIYHQHPNMDYDKMTNIVIKSIVNLID